MINMPYGGGSQFYSMDLVAHIRASGQGYIIFGGCNCALMDHKKPHSLDYWLRERSNNRRDVRQTCQELVAALMATELFVEEQRLHCPDSGRLCKGMRLA